MILLRRILFVVARDDIIRRVLGPILVGRLRDLTLKVFIARVSFLNVSGLLMLFALDAR